jgi:ferrochelatase
MEVIYDLDTEARATAERLSFPVSRAATPGLDPRFVGLPRDLLVERAAAERGGDVERTAVGDMAAWPEICAVGCCPNPRGEQPVVGGPQSPPRLVR